MTERHTALDRGPSDLIGGAWIELSGDGIRSENPARPAERVWQGTPVAAHVDRAVAAASAALPAWSAWSIEQRAGVLRRFAAICAEKTDQLADLLCVETGKALWECKGEAGLLAGKVTITITLDEQAEQNWGRSRVTGYTLSLNETKSASTHFRPHGVMAVLGPFN
ncbi:MAG: aldehyde dehydrogenase family protein, partial [Planctomycetota bacterium]